MIGNIYESNNHGKFKVVEYKNYTDITVEFLDTGYRVRTTKRSVVKGSVRDLNAKTVCGVGFIGEGKYKTTENKVQLTSYTRWYEIIRRCYHERSLIKHPTYKDCTVDKRWHNYQVFAKWFEENYIEGYEIDKDIKIEGNRVYGPDTCVFVSPLDNIVKAKATEWVFICPKGNTVNVYNLKKFCRDNNLNDTNMYSVYYGKAKHHKGWTSLDNKIQGSLALHIHKTEDGEIITRTTKLSEKESIRAIKKRTGKGNIIIFAKAFQRGSVALHLHESIRLLDKTSQDLLLNVEQIIEDYIGDIDDKEKEE